MDRYNGGAISSTYYYHSDVLGSVVALSDASGNVVERMKYSPYGQPYFLDNNQQPIRDLQGNFAMQSSVGNPLLFTAARYDAELSQRTNTQTTDKPGNYYLRNRYLNPNQGRFLTRDPIGIWTDAANLGGGYSYGNNDPINWVDPLGLACHFSDGGKGEEVVEEGPMQGPSLPDGAYWDPETESWKVDPNAPPKPPWAGPDWRWERNRNPKTAPSYPGHYVDSKEDKFRWHPEDPYHKPHWDNTPRGASKTRRDPVTGANMGSGAFKPLLDINHLSKNADVLLGSALGGVVVEILSVAPWLVAL